MNSSQKSRNWLIGGIVMAITLTGVIYNANATTTKTESRNEPIYFETKTIYDDTKYTDYSKTQQEGIDGKKIVTYSVVYKNGREEKRTKQSEEIVTPAQEKIIVKGSKIYYLCSNGARFDSSKEKEECEDKILWTKQRDAELEKCKADANKTNCWYDEYPNIELHYNERTVAPARNTTYSKTTVTNSSTRTGAICKDGSRSSATGKGACSHHGGVSYWL